MMDYGFNHMHRFYNSDAPVYEVRADNFYKNNIYM